MRRFLRFRFLVPVLLILLSNCKFGEFYKRRRVDNHQDEKKQDEQVLLGVPILYEQRKYVAKEFGIDPRLIMGNMRDFLLSDTYPTPDEMLGEGDEESMSLLSGGSLKRVKRGIIWNKIQRVKKGIQRVQKSLVSVRNRITKLFKGPETSTERPKYPSTAGDGGPKWKGGSSTGGGYGGGTGSSSTGGGWGQSENSGGYSNNNNNNNNQGGYGGGTGGGNGWSRSATSSSNSDRGDTSTATTNHNINKAVRSTTGTGSSASYSSTYNKSPPSSTWSSTLSSSSSQNANGYKRSSSGVSAVRSSRELEMIAQRFDSKLI